MQSPLIALKAGTTFSHPTWSPIDFQRLGAPIRYIHPACKTTLWKKNGEWWCPKCRTWVPEKILHPQAEIDKGLQALMPKLVALERRR